MFQGIEGRVFDGPETVEVRNFGIGGKKALFLERVHSRQFRNSKVPDPRRKIAQESPEKLDIIPHERHCDMYFQRPQITERQS